MQLVEESADRLVIEHRAGPNARSTIWVFLFIAAVFIVGPIFMTLAGDVLPPATRVVECDRASGQCKINPRWAGQDWKTFPVSQLEKMEAYQVSDDGYVLAALMHGTPDYFSHEVDAPADVAALRHAVDEMHAFAKGTAPALHVEWPRGHFKPGMIGRVLFFLLGLANLAWSRRTIWFVRVTADKSDVVVERKVHPLWPAGRYSIPASSIKSIATANVHTPPTRPSFNLAMVALRNADGREILLERESPTASSVQGGRDLADKLAKFLGVPVEPVKA